MKLNKTAEHCHLWRTGSLETDRMWGVSARTHSCVRGVCMCMLVCVVHARTHVCVWRVWCACAHVCAHVCVCAHLCVCVCGVHTCLCMRRVCARVYVCGVSAWTCLRVCVWCVSARTCLCVRVGGTCARMCMVDVK